ncbi:MAG: 2-oxo acid dehydrogenase subunit E2, partial [Gammaproteobacteria bacterium]
MEIVVKVPDIGDFKDVEIIDVLVADGDSVDAEQGLITIETDKAAMDVPSTHAGKIVSLKVKVGDKVSEGSEIAVVEASDKDEAPQKPEPVGADEPDRDDRNDRSPSEPEEASESSVKADAGESSGGVPPHASPSVRKFARELGVNLSRVSGSGRKNRITHEDVKAHVKGVMQGGGAQGSFSLPQMPQVDFSKWGEVETQPLTRIQRIAGPHLQRAWVTIPHVTQHDEADITDLEVMRKAMKGDAEKVGAKLTPLAFILKACVHALQEFPNFNASLDGENLILKRYYHIGFAVDTPE